MLKKGLAILFLLFCVVPAQFSEGRNEVPVTGRNSVVMGTSGLGSSWYPTATRLSVLCGRYTSTDVSVVASGGGTDNIRQLRAGLQELGIAESNIMVYSFRGKGLFEGNGYPGIRFVASLYPVVMQAVVSADSGVSVFSEMEGRSIAFSGTGAGAAGAWKEILETAFELESDRVVFRSFPEEELGSMFMNWQADVLGYEGGCPSGLLIELSSKREIRVLPVAGRQRERLMARYSWYRPWTVPAETYGKGSAAVETVAVEGVIVADQATDEKAVYDIVSTLFGQGLGAIREVHEMSSYISPEKALRGIGPVPLHPGAEQYYREMKLVK